MAAPDIYSVLFGDDDSPQSRKALAAALRGQREFGTLALATGSPTLARAGQAALEGAEKDTEAAVHSDERRLMRALQAIRDQQAQAERAVDNARADASADETKRFHQWQMDNPALQIVEGQGGGMVGVNPRSLVTQPVPAPGGAQLQKNRPLGESETKALESMAAERNTLRDFLGEFKDEYAGGPGTKLKTVLGQMGGGIAPASFQDAGRFWSKFELLRTLPMRKDIFGSSLSANEKASFDRANLLNPNTDPAIIRRTAQELEAILESKLSARTKAEVSQGASREAVGALTAPRKKKSQPYKDADGNWYVEE